MKIRVNTVEGETAKKGPKQGREYTLTPKGTPGFYIGTDETGRECTIYDVNGDWTRIGICASGKRRYSYTSNFSLIIC